MDNDVSFCARTLFKLINVCLRFWHCLKCLFCSRFLHFDDLQCIFKEVFSNKKNGQQLILRKRSARFSKMKWNIGLSNVSFFFQVQLSSVYLHGPSRLYGYNLKTFYSNSKPCCILFRFAKLNRNNAIVSRRRQTIYITKSGGIASILSGIIF